MSFRMRECTPRSAQANLWAAEVAALEAELAEAKRELTKRFAELVAERSARNAARAEVEQLKAKLAEAEAERDGNLRKWSESKENAQHEIDYERNATDARVLAMRDACAKMALDLVKRRGFMSLGDEIADAIERLPTSTGTASDLGVRCFTCGKPPMVEPEAVAGKWYCSRACASNGTDTIPVAEIPGFPQEFAAFVTENLRTKAQADAIKAAVAAHVCKCENGPCPKCGGAGPEGEWFEGDEVECADCGVALIVATTEPCLGRSTFEAINEESEESDEDNEEGAPAPGAVPKDGGR